MTDAIDAEFSASPLAVRPAAPIAAPQLLDALRPAERVALLAEISSVVQDVIEKQGWYKQIGPKKHILIQGWTFIGGLGGCSVKTTSTEKIPNGYKAHAVVVRVDTGIEVGSADQVCMTSESKWKGKDDYALIGMASTRACSRALSTVFRHVVELAGYSATPAEEMIAEDKPLPTSRKTGGPGRVPQDELLALARSVGLADLPALGRWCIESGIAPDLMSRKEKRLTDAETVAAKERLESLIPEPPPQTPRNGRKAPASIPPTRPKPVPAVGAGAGAAADDGRKMTPRTQGRLFALFSERLSDEHEARHLFAAEHGIHVDSFSTLTEVQGRALIRQLEMIPPPRDEREADEEAADAALVEYAEHRLRVVK